MGTMSTAEAAKLLGVSRQTVIRAFDAGHLQGYRTSAAKHAHIRLYSESVAAYRAALHERQPAEANAAP